MKSLGMQHNMTQGYYILNKDNEEVTNTATFKVTEVAAADLKDPCEGCVKGGAVWGAGAQACRICAPH